MNWYIYCLIFTSIHIYTMYAIYIRHAIFVQHHHSTQFKIVSLILHSKCYMHTNFVGVTMKIASNITQFIYWIHLYCLLNFYMSFCTLLYLSYRFWSALTDSNSRTDIRIFQFTIILKWKSAKINDEKIKIVKINTKTEQTSWTNKQSEYVNKLNITNSILNK